MTINKWKSEAAEWSGIIIVINFTLADKINGFSLTSVAIIPAPENIIPERVASLRRSGKAVTIIYDPVNLDLLAVSILKQIAEGLERSLKELTWLRTVPDFQK